MRSLFRKTFLTIFLVVSVAFPALAATDTEKPLSLRDSVEYTLRNNPTIKAFQEYRQAAEHDLDRAKSGYYPRVDLTGGIGMEQWEDYVTRDDNYSQDKHKFYGRSDVSLVITQSIFDGWATTSRKQMSQAMLNSAEYRLLDNAEVLSLDAILAHVDIIRQLQLLSLAETNVRNHQNILGSQSERQEAGVANLSDVTQTQSRLARAEATLAETRLALQNAYDTYKNLTGLVPADLDVPLAPEYSYPSLENALANSMVNNSKVRYSRADVDTAYAQKELDKAANYPSLYLQAGPSYSWQVGNADTDQWNTAVQLRTEWNLYNGFYDRNTLKGNKARIRQANRELQALRNSLAQETSNTWTTWQIAREQTILYANSVLYSTQTRDMYLEQFNVGQRSLLDVLDAENELFTSSMQLVTAQMNEIAAQYRLITLGGKLFGYFAIDGDLLKIATDLDNFTDRDLTGDTVNNHTFMPDADQRP